MGPLPIIDHFMLSFFHRCFVWICRLPHRRGYGVHSPFAFNLIRDVIFETGEYYAYAPLRAKRHAHQRPERDLRLLFRLANAHRSASAVVCVEDKHSDPTDVVAYLRAARPQMPFYEKADNFRHPSPTFYLFLSNSWPAYVLLHIDKLEADTLLVVAPITGKMAQAWQQLCQHSKTRVCFDLYDFGVVFFNPDHQAEVHKVNRAF